MGFHLIHQFPSPISVHTPHGEGEYNSGLPSVESYEEDKTFKQKSKWTKVNKQL